MTEWIIYSLVITACAAAMAAAADRLAVAWRLSRRGIWVSALVVGVLVPLTVAIRPGEHVLPEVSAVKGAADAGATLTRVAGTTGANSAVPFLLLWGVCSLVALAWVASGVAQLHRARRRALRAELCGTEVLVSPNLGPGVLPFGRPRIVVPGWVLTLPSRARELLHAHEQEHVRRKDAEVQLTALVAVSLLPWNLPLIWIVHRLRAAIELDCDQRVLQNAGGGVRAYADVLLVVAGRGHHIVQPLLGFSRPSTLRQRIDAMTTRRTHSRISHLGGMAVLLAALTVACEQRLPPPVAPVSDVSIRDGQASAMKIGADAAERMRQTLGDILAGTTLSGDATQPVLVVFDATGSTLFVGRMPAKSDKSFLTNLPPDDISSVEVFKSSSALPPEAKAGVIQIRLKAGSTWKAPTP